MVRPAIGSNCLSKLNYNDCDEAWLTSVATNKFSEWPCTPTTYYSCALSESKLRIRGALDVVVVLVLLLLELSSRLVSCRDYMLAAQITLLLFLLVLLLLFTLSVVVAIVLLVSVITADDDSCGGARGANVVCDDGNRHGIVLSDPSSLK